MRVIMKKNDIRRTRDLNLCISCEICKATCPNDAIEMEYKFGQYLPHLEEKHCIKCGACFDVCPGYDLDPFGMRSKEVLSEDVLDGFCLGSYTAYSNNSNIRKNSTSGGLITDLIIELLKNKEIDDAFVLNFQIFEGRPPRLEAKNKIEEILDSAGSKYIPASVYNVAESLKSSENKKYLIVATPCNTLGIKKFITKFNISEKNLVLFGLFCERTLNFNFIRFLEETYKKGKERLIKLQFRTKEKYGWPGNLKMCFDSSREIIIKREVRVKLKKYFQLNRCLFCYDKLNRFADISFGDCYIKSKEDLGGKSSVIVRTEKGKSIFDRYSYLFTLEEENIKNIRKSQILIDKKMNLEYAKFIIQKNHIYNEKSLSVSSNLKSFRKLRELKKYIKWGSNYKKNKIKFSLFIQDILNKIKKTNKSVEYFVLIIRIIVKRCFAYWIGRKASSFEIPRDKKNIVILGGGFSNKGSQAMTFTTVDQMRRRFPNLDIFVFSKGDFNRENYEKDMYKFDFMPWDLKIKLRILKKKGKLFDSDGEFESMKNKIEKIIRNTAFFIDISGYALSSQWGFFHSFDYILNIVIAERFSVPMYLFPQSMGPFDYPLKQRMLLFPLMKLYLNYPLKIFLREEEGLNCMRRFSKKNVEKTYDLVLYNDGYKFQNIYYQNTNFRLRDIYIEQNSVGIIPNIKLIKYGSEESIYSIYSAFIEKLIESGKSLYILHHSSEDKEMCKRIKKLFSSSGIVRIILDDLNAIELEHVIKQFDFVVASRYHSIIHSYKNRIPALVIGWATKYFELLRDFNQLNYFLDCRKKITHDDAIRKLYAMLNSYKKESENINYRMEKLNQVNIFDLLP